MPFWIIQINNERFSYNSLIFESDWIVKLCDEMSQLFKLRWRWRRHFNTKIFQLCRCLRRRDCAVWLIPTVWCTIWIGFSRHFVLQRLRTEKIEEISGKKVFQMWNGLYVLNVWQMKIINEWQMMERTFIFTIFWRKDSINLKQ